MNEGTFREIMKQAKAAVCNVRTEVCERDVRFDRFVRVCTQELEVTEKRLARARSIYAEHKVRLCNAIQDVKSTRSREFKRPLENLAHMRTKAVRDACVQPTGAIAVVMGDTTAETVFLSTLSRAWALVREVEKRHHVEVE